MTIEEKIFTKKRPCFELLEKNGFKKSKDKFVFEQDFMNGDFHAIVEINKDGIIQGRVVDLMTNEEYLPLRIESRNGSFVSLVRNKYEELLNAIAESCYTDVLFYSEQAKRIASDILDEYNYQPISRGARMLTRHTVFFVMK